MSDALPFPPNPDLEQYKELAKDLVESCKSGDSGAIRAWSAKWLDQLVDLELQAPLFDPLTASFRNNVIDKLEKFARNKMANSAGREGCELADAQFVIAGGHGFVSWPSFAQHLEDLARVDSPISKFETAVDAIVNGDAATLKQLLNENPELVRARSSRAHRSTLLHYVSANGVEDFRQKTPSNIVEIAELLLKAGADVNAESEAYGGRSTTLGLTATSWHPEHAGVQFPLMEVLIDHGAIIDGPDGGSEVNGCLHNGRGKAAEFFASRGARLDLEGAAGVGRLDIVKSFFDDNGSLRPSATEKQLQDGFAWACQFGRTNVVQFLLQSAGMATRLKQAGQTGLHWAAYGGHLDIVKLLLESGAPVDAKDETYEGTPLVWALYAWGNSTEVEVDRERHYEVVTMLVRSGARLDQPWYEVNEGRRHIAAKIRSDPVMLAALKGEMRG